MLKKLFSHHRYVCCYVAVEHGQSAGGQGDGFLRKAGFFQQHRASVAVCAFWVLLQSGMASAERLPTIETLDVVPVIRAGETIVVPSRDAARATPESVQQAATKAYQQTHGAGQSQSSFGVDQGRHTRAAVEQPIDARATLTYQGNRGYPSPNDGQSLDQTTASHAGGAPVWELYHQLEALQEEVRQLRGGLEAAEHHLQLLEKQQTQRYIDVDQRLSTLQQLVDGMSPRGHAATSQANAVSTTNTPPAVVKQATVKPTLIKKASPSPVTAPAAQEAAPAQPRTGEQAPHSVVEQDNKRILSQKEQYEAVYKRLEQQSFQEAEQGFQAFVLRYPEGPLTGNAYYWLAELSLRRSPPEEGAALGYLEQLLVQFPSHNKVPDALYKKATLLYRQGDAAAATDLFQEIMQQYPDTTAARLSDHQLQRLEGKL